MFEKNQEGPRVAVAFLSASTFTYNMNWICIEYEIWNTFWSKLRLDGQLVNIYLDRIILFSFYFPILAHTSILSISSYFCNIQECKKKLEIFCSSRACLECDTIILRKSSLHSWNWNLSKGRLHQKYWLFYGLTNLYKWLIALTNYKLIGTSNRVGHRAWV